MSFKSPGGLAAWFLHNTVRVLLALFVGLFTVMVACLIGFHLFLAAVNLTTWEYLSWSRISYLKNLDWNKGSPFSHGVLINLYDNCCRRAPNYLKDWDVRQVGTGVVSV
jgi:palmitoyltransferase